MDIRNRRALKEAAGAKLAAAQYDPRRLALVHTGAALGVALLVMLINYLIGTQVETAGGLSGMGMRSVLGTVQTTLEYAVNIAMPFWEMGFIYAAVCMARGQRVGPASLLEGFRRFGPVLRLRLMKLFLYFGAAIACVYAASFLFMLTPFSTPMVETLLPLMESAMTVEEMELVLMQLPTEELIQMSVPYLVIFGILFLVAALFLCYRFRVADFILMDEPKTGALLAMSLSTRMTRRNRWELLKLDLSFWWFYLLAAVSVAVTYGDVLLPLMGVTLPMSAEAAWFVFYLLGAAVQLGLYWYGYSHLQTTWAVAHDTLRQMLQEQLTKPAVPQPVPQKLPWDDYQTE